MKARDLMTPDPACCLREPTIREAAALMREYDCGSIPVVDSMEKRKLIGIVTDRDIAIRAAASDREVGRIVEAISEPNPND